MYKYKILGKVAAMQAVLQDISAEVSGGHSKNLQFLGDELSRSFSDLRGEMDNYRHEAILDDIPYVNTCSTDDF